MSVAWIGSQPVSLMDAVQKAAGLLKASRCPVFTIDADVHGTRSAIALAERVGAAYDHPLGAVLSREVALFTDHGGMFTTAGEVRNRSDVIVVAGDIPHHHAELLLGWANSAPRPGSVKKRSWFHIHGAGAGKLPGRVRAVPLHGEGLCLGTALAVLRATLQGRQTLSALTNIDRLLKALSTARFPVFVFSGQSGQLPDLIMLQDMVADLNKKGRAGSMFLPADDGAWGTALASLWMTGFPPRTGFRDSLPSYDPVRWDIQRMIKGAETDLHVWMSTRGGQTPPKGSRLPLISLGRTAEPAKGTAVTIAVGEAGLDHDGVYYSSMTGTFRAVQAAKPSQLPSLSGVLGQLGLALPGRKALAC
jgi:formylmethanofuran dehydrogenase subunit B